MADETPVNSQITDAVTQTNVKVVGEAPAQAMGMVYQSMAHSISLSMQNAMQAQGGLQQIGNAVTSSACRLILDATKGGMGS
ncbi:RebB family R body protein [Nisaea acidiphila]|uniref:RebB family R body protein n=1 Tax=Nisaea acidiphila TaxID=1862145 RepID=A0A9J7ANY1_9PROT|nr:RebB family R body protein [Nisaea acidiphila]UUX48044.1 RebB family R body protein [Nisaea acidiphila]